MQDVSGVRREARSDSPIRNRRDPPRPPTSGKDRSYKPMAKGIGAGRESEGSIVLLTVSAITASEGRDPALVTLVAGGTYEGMT